MTKSGAATSGSPKFNCFDEMTFLHEKVVTGLIKAIYSYDQLSFSPPFSHVHAKFQKKSNTNTVSQFSGWPWENWKVDEIKKHLIKKILLEGRYDETLSIYSRFIGMTL